MIKMTKTEWAYMAGIIDGEGCIGSQKHSNAKTYRPYLVVVQKDIRLIEWLYSRFGGYLSVIARERKDHTDCYLRWLIANYTIVDVLKGCLPYLTMKQEQAKCVIEMVEKAKSFKQRGYRNIPQSLYDLQFDLYRKIRNLNSPATTERGGSFTKEMRQSELTQMKNRKRENRSIFSAEQAI